MSAHENPHAGQGSVLLDIGGDVGALVVVAPDAMTGREVEIAPAGESFRAVHRPHVAVVRRPVVGGAVASLVFPAVAAGRYALAEKGTADVRLVVEVRGGEVTGAAWPAD
ncbi:hypothetical protein [Nocardioides aquiterrae]|uniref:Phospholipase n=1 Tax=Nocardioides aquiterrae TaxID=203799 RepID=A0ABN1UNQ5_9ACTN